jgi:tetratricopeptide (TPR) repeat protein
MIASANYSDLIENYREGVLSEKENQQVNDLLERDIDFEKEFRLHEQVDLAIMDSGMMNFEKSLQGIHKNYERKRSMTFIWRAAASILFLIGIGSLGWLVMPGMVNSGDNLVNSYYETYSPLSAFRSGDQPSDLLLAEAFDLFTRKDFSNAATKFKDLLNMNPSNNMARFYLGISLIETGKAADAIPLMQEIIQVKDVLFENQAEWYLSLCYLKTNNKDEAKKHLKVLVGKNSHYKDKAQSLLKDLR